MAETLKLKKFHVEQEGDAFHLQVEDEDGTVFEVIATHDQVDLIADMLDDLLDADEESEAVDDERDEDEDEKA